MSYTITGNNIELAHTPKLWGKTRPQTLCVRDILYNDHNELKVHVRSDEYFSMLANILDAVSDPGKNNCKRTHPELQKIINDLLFLQRHYRIIKK